MKITPDLFAAFLKCPTKCWLRTQGETGDGNEYADWVRTQNESYRRAAVDRLLEGVPASECHYTSRIAERPDPVGGDGDPGRDGSLSRPSSPTDTALPADVPRLKTAKWRLAVDLPVQTPDLESRLHAVERIPSEGRGKPAQFIPIRFVFTNKLTKDDRLLVAFDALVLSEVLGREVSLGRIIHGDDQATLKVKVSTQFKEVRKRIEKMAALLSNQSPPDLILRRHCTECEFQKQCRQKAIDKDDLSLLAGMSEKERKKFNNKGIFTVTQLSYTFRPRRRPRKLRNKREKYHHALKALAIREKKIHIVGSPELKIEGTPVYLDVEGLPDRDFYYLIGLRIGNGDSAVQHSLWADSVVDEGKIWRELLAILETVEQPVLIHYGSYETTFLKRMCERYGQLPETSGVAQAMKCAVNLLTLVFAQTYFPAFSNGLKDVVGYLGFKWSEAEPSGAKTIVWRHTWEAVKSAYLQQKLITYNAEDCQALELVTRTVLGLTFSEEQRKQKTDCTANIVHAEYIQRSKMWKPFRSPINDFEQINKAARWDYQRERVYIRSSQRIRRTGTHVRSRCPRSTQINKLVVCSSGGPCPQCNQHVYRYLIRTTKN